MLFKAPTNATCLEADVLLTFNFLLSHVRRGVTPSVYNAIVARSPYVLFLLIDHLEYSLV